MTDKFNPMHFGNISFVPKVELLPISTINHIVKPRFLHVTNLPPEFNRRENKEEALDFIAHIPNPRNLPMKFFPEPEWFDGCFQEM